MVQDSPAARVAAQELVSPKSPRIETPIPVRGAVPVLVNVVWKTKLLEPIPVSGKVAMLGVRVAPSAVPKPKRLIVWVWSALPTLSAKVSTPLRGPVTEGVNVTV